VVPGIVSTRKERLYPSSLDRVFSFGGGVEVLIGATIKQWWAAGQGTSKMDDKRSERLAWQKIFVGPCCVQVLGICRAVEDKI